MTQHVEAEYGRCTNCGATEFEWGWVHERGITLLYPLYSKIEGVGYFGLSGLRVKARRCLQCNHIALFAMERRKWRFSLRTLLIVTTVVAVVLGLIVYAV